MNTKTAKPNDFPYILSECLSRIANSPAQFIKEGQIVGHNLPDGEQVRLELASPPNSKIELVYDIGSHGDTNNVVRLKVYRINITRGKNVVRIEGLKNFSSAAKCSENDMLVALHFICDELTDQVYELAEKERIRKDTLADSRAAMRKMLNAAGIKKVSGTYDRNDNDEGCAFLTEVEPKGKSLSDKDQEDIQNLIWDFAYDLNRGFGQFRWSLPDNRIDISHTTVIHVEEEYENL